MADREKEPAMQRAWITGLTLAGVLGTGGAAFAGMSLTHIDGSAVEAQSPAAAATTAAVSTATTYRLGDAGLVTLDSAGGMITITSVTPSTGWSVVASSNPGLHVELSLTDTVQVLQLTADLVDGKIVAALTTSSPVADPTTAAPAPAPAPASASPVVALVPTARPAIVATTSASGSTHVTKKSGSTRHESDEREGGDDD
jgi:hypothetical protein